MSLAKTRTSLTCRDLRGDAMIQFSNDLFSVYSVTDIRFSAGILSREHRRKIEPRRRVVDFPPGFYFFVIDR